MGELDRSLKRQMERRELLRAMAALPLVGGAGALLAACENNSTEKSSPIPSSLGDLAKAGTDVPPSHINWAMAPFPEETIAVIGMNAGYFDEVGISIGPTSTGAKFDLTESLAPLLTSKVDIGSAAWESLGAQLDTVDNVLSFIFIGFFTGMAFMAPPESSAKTVQDFMDEGEDFNSALHSTIEQLQGKRVALATDPGARLFYQMTFDLAEISAQSIERSDLSNPNIVNLALAGQTDFPAPSGGTEVVRLLQEGFKVLVDQQQILEGSDDPRRLQIVSHTAYITTDQFYTENYQTILRAASVIYRILDDLNTNNLETTSKYQLDFLNAYTGQSTTAVELGLIQKNISRLTTFEDVKKYYIGDTAFNVYTAGDAQLQELEKQGVLHEEHHASEMEGAKRVWEDLSRLKKESDSLLAKVGDTGDQTVIDKARSFYEHRNYLDSYRFLATLA